MTAQQVLAEALAYLAGVRNTEVANVTYDDVVPFMRGQGRHGGAGRG
ncbi:hypothetical protein [Lichenifustis flavocetrariae]|uniref:Uncharacterized protein n=1 Tax=Lichenifustis flavocetrariae TaxID=2949735 RepID=A0AA42CMC3_9HYPH|nr:hypothetical protein [Lichenifustis flavocetrariae]MCW6512408.1 hypothetical protein [Lichenifustis flavocetrariae]